MSTTGGWFFWAVLSAGFAALTAIFAKVGIQGVDSDLATLVRTVIIVFVLGASWVYYFRALQLGRASPVAPVDKFSLVLVAIFAFLFLGERPAPREWLGIALVAAGVLVLAVRR